jgi:hypothetical protein
MFDAGRLIAEAEEAEIRSDTARDSSVRPAPDERADVLRD